MSTAGFSTAFGSYEGQGLDFTGSVFKARLCQSNKDGGKKVLVFFQSTTKLELMMVDESGISVKDFGTKGVLRKLKRIRKEIPGLSTRPKELRSRIISDVKEARSPEVETRSLDVSRIFMPPADRQGKAKTNQKVVPGVVVGPPPNELLGNPAAKMSDAPLPKPSTSKPKRRNVLNPTAAAFKPRAAAAPAPSPSRDSLRATAQPFLPSSMKKQETKQTKEESKQAQQESIQAKQDAKQTNQKEHTDAMKLDGSGGAARKARSNSTAEQFARSVYVNNIPKRADWMHIATAFRPVGPTVRVYRKPGENWAHVYFPDVASVETAVTLAMQGRILIGEKKLSVRRRERVKMSERRIKKSLKISRAYFSAASAIDQLQKRLRIDSERKRAEEKKKAKAALLQQLASRPPSKKKRRYSTKSAPAFSPKSSPLMTTFAPRTPKGTTLRPTLDHIPPLNENEELLPPAAPAPAVASRRPLCLNNMGSVGGIAMWGGDISKLNPQQPQLLPVLKVEVQGEIHAPRLPVVSIVRRAMGIASPPVSPTDTAASFKVIRYEHLVIEVSNEKKLYRCKEADNTTVSDDEKSNLGRADSDGPIVKTFSRAELLGLRTSEKVRRNEKKSVCIVSGHNSSVDTCAYSRNDKNVCLGFFHQVSDLPDLSRLFPREKKDKDRKQRRGSSKKRGGTPDSRTPSRTPVMRPLLARSNSLLENKRLGPPSTSHFRRRRRTQSEKIPTTIPSRQSHRVTFDLSNLRTAGGALPEGRATHEGKHKATAEGIGGSGVGGVDGKKDSKSSRRKWVVKV
uniref:RRM domain-containing protein n=2 Tax=Lotharella globosa TaxID=91324 RepID=A0A6V3LE24_9EUKA